MKNNNAKEFNINGTFYYFNLDEFNNCFYNYLSDLKKEKNKKITLKMAEEKLAFFIELTPGAIRNWRYHISGPRSVDTIKKIAEFFDKDNINLFLIKKSDTEQVTFTDHQKEAIKKIYDAIIDFMFKFRNTDGFNPQMSKNSKADLRFSESNILDFADHSLNQVEQVSAKENYYLHDLEIYYELQDFIKDYLYDICNVKRGFPFRFETTARKLSASEEFEKGINRLNRLIEKYGL